MWLVAIAFGPAAVESFCAKFPAHPNVVAFKQQVLTQMKEISIESAREASMTVNRRTWRLFGVLILLTTTLSLLTAVRGDGDDTLGDMVALFATYSVASVVLTLVARVTGLLGRPKRLQNDLQKARLAKANAESNSASSASAARLG